MLKRLWLDECGAVLSAELILLLVITVIGMVVGLTALRDAVDLQLCDVAGAIAAIDPGFGFSGLRYQSSGLLGGTTNGGFAWVNASEYSAVELPTGSQSMLFAVTTGKLGALTGSP